MKELPENLERTEERSHSNGFALSVAVGLIVFFVTRESAGGLTGTQGFFIGVSAVILLYAVTVVFGGHKIQSVETKHETFPSVPGNVLITQSENQGITIHIQLSKDVASNLGEGRNDR